MTEWASAFHIAGGDLTCTWVSGNTYRIRLTLFRDCSNPSGADYDDEIILGVYRKVDDSLLDSLHFQLETSSIRSLELSGTACVTPPQVCMQEAWYEREVELPNQPGGYYVVWERCCRNNTIINIINPQGAGLAFYEEIPDPALHNSSPVFNSAPLPFVCAGQYFRFEFSATDADGDSLVYELTDPLDGGHTGSSSPNPFSPNGDDTPPPPKPYDVTLWENGFSLANVSGGATPMTINASTGQVTGTADVQGIYAMAVAVYEYRNGVLIGITRREIEFTVIVCTGNSTPDLSPNVVSAEYELHATDTLEFEVRSLDPDGDSLHMTHYGEVFEGMSMTAISAPFAIGSDTIGKDSVITRFSWIPDCDQWRDKPYDVTYEITDNGCPLPLTAFGRFKIRVKKVPSILKPNLICLRIINPDVVKIDRAPDTSIIPRYFDAFTLFRSTDGSPYQAYRTFTDPAQITYYDSSAQSAKQINYCYYLQGSNSCLEDGETSDTLCTTAFVNIEKMQMRSVSVDGDRSIQLAWQPLADAAFRHLEIYKTTREHLDSTSFRLLSATQGYLDEKWNDKQVYTNQKSYCYTLQNIDHCGNISPRSDPACSILLQGESGYYQNKTNWTPYINWEGGVQSYELERSDDNVSIPLRKVAVLSGFQESYLDELLNAASAINHYRVHAIEGPGSLSGESYSNIIELVQQPQLFVPNAFTPNNDGKNEVWHGKSSFVNSYEVWVYNRFGQVVWHSQDPQSTWNGDFQGQQAPEGVYCYRFHYTGYANYDYFDKVGTVTLIR